MANTLKGKLTPKNNMKGSLTNEGRLTGQLGGVGAAVTYASLPDKPSINGVTLVGNTTTSDLNISYNDLRDQPVIPDVGEIDERLDNLEGNITSLGGRLTTAEGNITTLQGDTGALNTRLTTAEGDITSLGGRVTTAEGDITSLGGRVTTAEGNITSLGERVTTAEGNITSLDGRVTTNEGNITSLDGRVTTNEGNISDLQGDMTQAQGDITQLNSSLTNLSALNFIALNTSGAYSDSALFNALKNDDRITPYKFCFYSAQFNGGMRYGFCFLYEGNKLNGTILALHYNNPPRYLGVYNGTVTIKSWATS